jgi:catechol 2,3-dioxygenase-like lactoylglutathione lyase family enzyme
MMRYVHTNLTCRDWRALVRFYCDVFGCVPKPPQRDLSGDWLEKLTSIPGARLQGLHLLLPGVGPDGPTLEIFEYETMIASGLPVVNQPGYGHLACLVDDVDRAANEVVAHGGSLVGEIVETVISGVGVLRVAYARDPEGNIVELQNWTTGQAGAATVE